VEEEFFLEQVVQVVQLVVVAVEEAQGAVAVVLVLVLFNVQVAQEELDLQQVEVEVHLEDFLMILLLQAVAEVGELVEVMLLLPGAMDQGVLVVRQLH
jgi:hypothetical protein